MRHFKSNKLPVCMASLTLALLAACGGAGSSADPTVVSAEFNALGVKGTANGQKITLDLSGVGNCATSIENMSIGVLANGASISPDPRIARNYSAPVEFTVTSPDGAKAVYSVTVIGANCINEPTPPIPPIPPTPPNCTAAPIVATDKYSLVYKGCDAANVAIYYDKTECVRENASGLIWEGQPATGTRSSLVNYLRSNFDNLTKLQAYTFTIPSVFKTPTQGQIDSANNTMGYQVAVNTANLCGFSDWRRPSPTELLALVKPGAAPQIDSTWFPNTYNGRYWTSAISTNTTTGAEYEGFAQAIDFKTGSLALAHPRQIDAIATDDRIAVRLVR